MYLIHILILGTSSYIDWYVKKKAKASGEHQYKYKEPAVQIIKIVYYSFDSIICQANFCFSLTLHIKILQAIITQLKS